MLDLGGASTQIVFEPEFEDKSTLQPGDHVYDLKFAEQPHVLYQHSYLGFGLMQARRAANNLVGFNWLWSQASTVSEWDHISAKDEVRRSKQTRLIRPAAAPVHVQGFAQRGRARSARPQPGHHYRGRDRRRLRGVRKDDFRDDAQGRALRDWAVRIRRCVPAESNGDLWPRDHIRVRCAPSRAAMTPRSLSYFYDRLAPLGLGVNDSSFRLSELKQLAQDVCLGPTHASFGDKRWHPRFRSADVPEARKELEDRPEYCLDLTFMYLLLSLGYDLSDSRQLRIGKKIDGVELGWCVVQVRPQSDGDRSLGAAIAMLDNEDLQCRV